jgi:hypothetical protein
MKAARKIRLVLVMALVVIAAAMAGARPAAGDDVEARIAAFWQRVNAMQPTDYLAAGDLGQWALNVIARESRARITVADFRASSAQMQAAMDRAGLGFAAVPVPIATPSPVPAPPLAIASASTSFNVFGWYEIVGEVRNSGSTQARFVKVIATFYDASGTVIDTDFSYTQPSDVAAGTAAPFRVTSTKGAAVARYKLVVSSS